MSEYRVTLLGPPAILRNGKKISLHRKKATAIAAYLTATQRTVSRDEIADIFWPGDAGPQAKGSLRTVLADIKNELGPDFIQSSDNFISADYSIIECDVIKFHDKIKSIESIPEMKSTAELWNGGFMNGFYIKNCSRFSGWQLLEEQNLEIDYRNLLHRLADNLTQTNQLAEALYYSRKCIELDPFDEKIHRQIMFIHALSGNIKAAAEQYSLCRQTIIDEFNFPPEEETEELIMRIKNNAVQEYESKLQPGIKGIERIAVIPFKISYADSQNNLYNEIISESIHTSLIRHSNMDVISRTSSLLYNNTKKNVHQIALELNADFLIEGSISKNQNKFIVEVNLIDAARDSVTSNEKTMIDVNKGDLESHTDNLVELLLKKKSGSENEKNKTYKTTAPAEGKNKALKLKARHLLRDYSRISAGKAVSLYKQAVGINSDDAEAWAGLANAYRIRGEEGLTGSDMAEVYRDIEDSVTRALSINPSEPTALWIKGLLTLQRCFDYESAEKYFLKSLELVPNNSEVLENYGILLLQRNRLAEAQSISEKACELDPVNLYTFGTKYWVYIALKKYRMALDVQLQIYKLFPDEYRLKYTTAFVHILTGKVELAIAEIEKIREFMLRDQQFFFLGELAYAYAVNGRVKKAEETIGSIFKITKTFYGHHLPLASAFTALGRHDAAVEWLERAVEARDPALTNLAVLPFYKPLYTNNRFKKLIKITGIIPQK